jgi:putative peptidoglycan lipid II flippase
VFAIAISTVILPNLSRQQATASAQQFNNTLDWAIRMVLLIAVPAAAALLVLAEPILITLFQYGELSPRDVAMAAFSLRAYSLGLLAFMLIKVLAPGYFARQDTKTPVAIGIKAMLANMLLNIAFVVPLHMYWQLGHVGLALATAGSAFLNAGLLYWGLRKAGVYRPLAGMGLTLLRVLLAATMMAALIVWFLPAAEAWLAWGWGARAFHITLFCGGGVLVYFVAFIVLGGRPRQFRMQPA